MSPLGVTIHLLTPSGHSRGMDVAITMSGVVHLAITPITAMLLMLLVASGVLRSTPIASYGEYHHAHDAHSHPGGGLHASG